VGRGHDRRLADAIEYSQPVRYSHFPGKDGILAAVALEGFTELAADPHPRRPVAEASPGATSRNPGQPAPVNERKAWTELREELGVDRAHPAYESARIAFELGAEVRALREQQGWSRTELAERAGMTQSAMARFEAG
jgi:Helix-turn-helix domain